MGGGVSHNRSGKVREGIVAAVIFTVVVLLLCGVSAMIFALARFVAGESLTASAVTESEKLPVIVIDAGHGGIDSGAVGVDGSLEKEINLSVAKRLAALCELSGIEYVLTRTDDNMLTPESVTEHRKMHDLKNRLAVTEEISGTGREAVLVSIHMNNFPSPKYSGLQVWYSKNTPESSELAAFVQGFARTWLDTSNTRQTKPATSAIYILDRAKVPAVLVECGFLSNPDECARLGTEEYQKDLTAVLFAAICEYLSKQ